MFWSRPDDETLPDAGALTAESYTQLKPTEGALSSNMCVSVTVVVNQNTCTNNICR